MTRDIQASILRACARFIAKRLDPLELRLKSIEDRGAIVHKGIDGVHGRDGRDGAPGERGAQGEKGLDGLHGKDGRDGIDGKDGAPGLNGKDGSNGLDGKDGAPGRDGVDGLPGKDGIDGKDGLPGKDGAPGERGPIGPAGEKGEDGINGKDGADGLNGKDGRDGIDGKDGRDGVDGKSITLDDVRPMLEGEVAKWALDFERRAAAVLERALDRMPKARDGVDGKDGRDGIDWSEFAADLDDDGRTIIITMGDGEKKVTHRLKTAIPIFRNSWKAGNAYEKGDCVNWGGCMWVAKRDTSERPSGGEDSNWQMAVRRGADAKVS